MAATQSAVTLALRLLVVTELALAAARDYYDTLGVPRDATARQIKKAFHRLAMKSHPDRSSSPDAEVRFREIAEAYETLSDETRRREYDHFSGRAAHFAGETPGGPRRGAQPPFTFSFDEAFRDFDIYSHNRHSRHRRHPEEHSRSHREAHGRHRRPFQGGAAGAGVLDDMLDDAERMFTLDRHGKRGEGGFRGASKQHCRTVTQRRGNMVTTYTDCNAA